MLWLSVWHLLSLRLKTVMISNSIEEAHKDQRLRYSLRYQISHIVMIGN